MPEQTTPAAPNLTAAQISELGAKIMESVQTVVVGMDQPLRIALAAILSGGHILFEDVPGLGKTLVAKSLAQALGLDFARLQCTPDLLPSDITGGSIFNPVTRAFEVRRGPIFTGLFLADEINRTAPKTQSALLEAMAEQQVTIDGQSFSLPQPFHVLATSNPVEFEGTYPLPEAQLDRFMVRISVGYPGTESEVEILQRRLARRTQEAAVARITDPQTLVRMAQGTELVHVDQDIVRYCVDIVESTRAHSAVEVGASPRGSQALLLLARAYAVLAGRDFVVPEDIKAVAVAGLAHRLTLTPTAWASGASTVGIVQGILNSVPGPVTVPAGQA